MKTSTRVFYALLALVTLLAAALALLSTRYGPGVGGDATIYLASARGLLDGIGLGYIDADGTFRLLPYFAPFFPLLLAFFGLFGLNLVTAAHWLNVLLFAGLIWLAGSSFYRLTRSAGLALALAALLALSPILLPVFSWAMSEPLSLALGFAGLWLAFRALDEPAPGKFFWLSALCVGLSFLTRYASAAFVGAGALALLFLRAGVPWGRRLRDALIYATGAALPMLAWVLVGLAQTATVGSRSVESAAGMTARFAAFWPLLSEALLGWLIPFSWIEAAPYPAVLNRLLLPALGIGLAVWAALLFARRGASSGEQAEKTKRWAALLAIFALLYLLVVLAVYVTTYPPITIENRMLSPLYVAAIWLLLALAALTAQRRARVGALLLIALVLFAGWNGWRTARIAAQNYQTGLGYNSLEWRRSETVAAVRELPPCTPLVTNEVTALMFLAQRKPYTFAEIFRSAPLETYTRYGDSNLEGDPAETLFRLGEAQLILFDTIDAQFAGLYGERTAERVDALVDGLTPVFTGEDGTIYVYPGR